LVTIGALLAALSSIHAASYTFTTIDVPGALATYAYGINDRNQIVGSYFDGFRNHGYLWDEGVFTTIDVPGAQTTFAYGINARGQIVGTCDFFFSGTHGFLWDQGVFTTIDVPGALGTVPRGINARGQIVGNWGVGDGIGHGFLWDEGAFSTLDVPNARDTLPMGITTQGQIVGAYVDDRFHGFLWDRGVFTTIDVPGASQTIAFGINERGQIVGSFGTPEHGFLWNAGMFTQIDSPNALNTTLYGVNVRGDLAGVHLFPRVTQGFLAQVMPDTTPPTMAVSASPATLWPPNGKLVAVTVSGVISDEPGGSGVDQGAAAFEVVDEYGRIQLRGGLTVDTDGQYAFTVALEASRSGKDRDGRHYVITVNATDNAGNRGSASTTVTVVHDQRP
jgi:probable HAF family extracellular repeat protein